MKKNSALSILLCGLAAVVSTSAGCGGTSGGKKLTPATFLVELGKASCEGSVLCGYAVAADVAACKAKVDADAAAAATKATPYDLATAVKSGNLIFDAARAKTCVESSRTPPSCTDSYFQNGTDCAGVFVAAVEVGGACKSDLECKSGQCLGATNDGCAGTCKAPVANGGSCDNSADRCADTALCNIPDGAEVGTCDPFKAAAGEVCESDSDCDYSHYCLGSAAAPTDLRCREAGAVGDPCYYVNFLGFTFTSCRPEIYCLVTDVENGTGNCAALSATGATCEQGDVCAPGTICKGLKFDDNTGAVTQTGTCVVPLAVGAACDPQEPYSGCPGDYPCNADTSTCAAGGSSAPGLGEDCTDYDCQSAFYCDNDYVCRTPVPFGGACTPRDPMVEYAQDPCSAGTCAEGTCALVCI